MILRLIMGIPNDFYSSLISNFFLKEHQHIIFKKTNRIQISYPELSSMEMAYQLDDQNYYTLGVNESLEVSSGIAIIELLERLAFDQYIQKNKECKSSNGFAAHPTLKSAKANALKELVERDAFFAHYLTGIPFKQINLPQSLLPNNVEREAILIGQMQCHSDYQAHIALIKSLQGGYLCGLGCSLKTENEMISIQKAMVEALNAYNHFLPHEEYIQEDFFSTLPNPQPYHHVLAGLNPSLGKAFADCYFRNSQEEVDIRPKYDLDVSYEVLPGVKDFEEIFVVRATSPDLQDLFWGVFKNEILNPHRFKNLTIPTSHPLHILP